MTVSIAKTENLTTGFLEPHRAYKVLEPMNDYQMFHDSNVAGMVCPNLILMLTCLAGLDMPVEAVQMEGQLKSLRLEVVALQQHVKWLVVTVIALGVLSVLQFVPKFG